MPMKGKPPWLKQKMGPDGKPMMKDGKPVMESARAVDGLADTALTAAETQRSAAMAASEARSALMAHVPLSGEPTDEQRTAWETKATELRADVATKEATYRTASEAMASADREHRAAVTADAEAQAEADRAADLVHPGEGGGWTSELREFRDIEERVGQDAGGLSGMLGAALGETVRDAQLVQEFRSAVTDGQDFDRTALAPDSIPIIAFAGPPSMRAEEDAEMERRYAEEQPYAGGLQHRVDATVSTPGTIAAYQNRIIQRVFTGSAMSFAGVRPRMVGVGDQLHPIITAGAAPGFVAKGAAKDTQDATIGVFTTSPKRLMIGYRIARVDLFRVVGMESALRMDLGRSMSNGFDREVLRGNSTNGIDGFFDALTALTIAGPPERFETAVSKLLRALDGELARALRDIKAIVNPVTARRLGSQFRGDSTMSVLNYIAKELGGVFISANVAVGTARAAGVGAFDAAEAVGQTALTVDGFAAGEVLEGDEVALGSDPTVYTVTSVNAGRTVIHVTPALVAARANNDTIHILPSTRNPALLIKSGPGYQDNTALDMWRGVTVRRDEITQVGEGNIRIFLECYHDFVIPRPAGYVSLPFYTNP